VYHHIETSPTHVCAKLETSNTPYPTAGGLAALKLDSAHSTAAAQIIKCLRPALGKSYVDNTVEKYRVGGISDEFVEDLQRVRDGHKTPQDLVRDFVPDNIGFEDATIKADADFFRKNRNIFNAEGSTPNVGFCKCACARHQSMGDGVKLTADGCDGVATINSLAYNVCQYFNAAAEMGYTDISTCFDVRRRRLEKEDGDLAMSCLTINGEEYCKLGSPALEAAKNRSLQERVDEVQEDNLFGGRALELAKKHGMKKSRWATRKVYSLEKTRRSKKLRAKLDKVNPSWTRRARKNRKDRRRPRR